MFSEPGEKFLPAELRLENSHLGESHLTQGPRRQLCLYSLTQSLFFLPSVRLPLSPYMLPQSSCSCSISTLGRSNQTRSWLEGNLSIQLTVPRSHFGLGCVPWGKDTKAGPSTHPRGAHRVARGPQRSPNFLLSWLFWGRAQEQPLAAWGWGGDLHNNVPSDPLFQQLCTLREKNGLRKLPSALHNL